MKWSELETERCPVARTLSVIGDRWTMLILRDALRGSTRFEQFHDRLKCSRAIVAERLAGLVERGLLRREQYEAHPPRFDYRLTDMGRSIGPVMMAMSQWSETWLPHPSGFRVERIHKPCGHAFQPVLHCSECGEPVRPGEVEHVDPAKGTVSQKLSPTHAG
jgi:DNA-binding HxlR family transcriptional regulator